MQGRSWLVVFFVFVSGACFATTDPTLDFVRAGDEEKILSLSQMKESVPVSELAFHDPEYDKSKRYRALALGQVLDLAFGPNWQGDEYTEMVFTAADGYASISTLEKLNQEGGYIVFEDLEYPGWEPVGRNQAHPGPFYLVWTNSAQSTERGYPWPWQLAKIELVGFQDRYPEVYPKNAAPESEVYAGFLTFKQRCMRCHAMNQQGGKIGPDLNAPQSVTDYRTPDMLKAFIRQPSQFRYSHMPDHTDLSNADLDNLLQYLKHMAK